MNTDYMLLIMIIGFGQVILMVQICLQYLLDQIEITRLQNFLEKNVVENLVHFTSNYMLRRGLMNIMVGKMVQWEI